jgi:radical SAM protein with 4Fe4S-binding SPASM domain
VSAPTPPRELQLEVTGACNLRCRMCLVRYRPPLDRHRGSLSFARFREIVDALPSLERVTLQGLGEPLMAPDLFEMLTYGAARGIEMGFNTNATLLTRRMAERLVQARLAWLCISLDGARSETYEAIRDGARFATVRRNVAGLTAVMRDRGAIRPALSLVFVAMRRNVDDLPALVRLAAQWGIATVRVQNLSHSFDDTDPAGAYREIRDFAAEEALWQGTDDVASRAFAEARAAAAELGVALRLPQLTPVTPPSPGTPGCDWPWRSAYIRHDGRVQPCCMLMGGDRAILGDLAETSFPALWSGPAYEKFRAALTTTAPPDVCRGCSMYRGVF